MTTRTTPRPRGDDLIDDACVDRILAELNASAPGLEGLDAWAASALITTDRIIEGPDVTYVRLVGEAEHGGPIVLLHFEGMWERATKSSPPSPARRAALTR
ncbi:MAG: hypothetical protein ACQEWM_06060 [Actinomycetota bacterium]